jgi:hypothetical protein
MPRTKTKINLESLQKLKMLVLEVSSIELKRSIDCDKLATYVSVKTKTYINGISFKRLYGFTQYPFNPSIQTLDILSKFVGFDSWNAFENYHSNKRSISKIEVDIYQTFFDIDFINDIDPHDGGFQLVARKIALRFREDPLALVLNLPQFMKKKQFQIFFAEHFPDYDNLCTYYYLIYESYLLHKKTPESQLFGNCMLFLKAFWLRDEAECSKFILEINKTDVLNFHPYLIGRYYACNLLYDTFFNDGTDFNDLFNEYLGLRNSLPKRGVHFLDFPASEYIIADALIHCRRFGECIRLIEIAMHDFSLRMEFVRKGYYRQIQLFYLVSGCELGLVKIDETVLKKIDPNNFYFISKDYFSVLYYYALGSEDALQKAKEIASRMGNLYLSEVFLTK